MKDFRRITLQRQWVVVDFESASRANLKRTGAYRYWADPTTEALCLGWKTHTGRRGLWWPGDPCPFPDKVFDEYMFVAHNCGFERNGWWFMEREFGWRPVPLAQWHDTSARALQLALPASLENVLVALKLPFEKDKEGTRAVLSLSRPDKKGNFPVRTPELMERIGHYCLDGDVEQQWALHRRIGWLPPHERAIWELSQEVNDRGIGIDMGFVRAAQKIVDEASKPLAAEFRSITGVNVGQRDKILQWCAEQGVVLENMRKETLSQVLPCLDDDPADEGEEPDASGYDADDEADGEGQHVQLPPTVERALRIRQLIGSASIKKLKAMRECIGYDGRARGLMVYHGTTPGRQTARLVQPHNFPRPTVDSVIEIEDPLPLVNLIKKGDWQLVEDCYGPAVETIVSTLRYALAAAPGAEYFSGDYSGIQARTVLALAGQHDKAAMMAAGLDVYIDLGADIHHLSKPNWDDKAAVKRWKLDHSAERQDGKNGVLGFGFQLGEKTAATKYFGGDVERAGLAVNTYRKEWAPCVPALWKGLQWAAIDTVWDREPHEFNGITYFLRDTALVARIPNGSEIHYQYPEKTRRLAPWSKPGEPIMLRGFDYRVQKSGRWITRSAFGGQLTENIVMKIEREIMEAAKQRLKAAGYLQVLEVHDENITEQPKGRSLDEFKLIMEDVDQWVVAMGIPIAVDCWQGPVYRK